MITWLTLHYKRDDEVVLFAMTFDGIASIIALGIIGSIYL
jgi:hypothetical protein